MLFFLTIQMFNFFQCLLIVFFSFIKHLFLTILRNSNSSDHKSLKKVNSYYNQQGSEICKYFSWEYVRLILERDLSIRINIWIKILEYRNGVWVLLWFMVAGRYSYKCYIYYDKIILRQRLSPSFIYMPLLKFDFSRNFFCLLYTSSNQIFNV